MIMGHQRRRLCWALSALLAAASWTGIAASAASVVSPSSSSSLPSGPVTTAAMDDDDGIIVALPLLSHHHVVERRRRELLLRASSSSSSSSGADALLPDDDGGGGGNHDHQRLLLRRSRSLSDEEGGGGSPDQLLGALYQGYGTHYLDVWVGYPPQRQTAVIDTGSSVTAFPCSDYCSDNKCGRHADPPFDETKSSSFRATQCPVSKNDSGCVFGRCDPDSGLCAIEHSFGTPGSDDASSWTAYEASDVAYAGGPHDQPVDGAKGESSEGLPPGSDPDDPLHAPEFSFPLTFGCQTSATGYFERQLASGVMGLDRRAQSFWGQMRASQVIKRAQFSLCFVRQPVASVSGSTAGAITLGGVDKRLHETPMVFAKSMGEGNSASYKVRLRKMYLREGNDVSVMFDAKSKYHLLNVIEEDLNGDEMYSIDSGTTDTYLIKSLSDGFREAWREATGMEYSNGPIALRGDTDLVRFPTIVMQMVPHEGGVGDEVRVADPRTVPGLAGNVDVSTPNDVVVAIPPRRYMRRDSVSGDGGGGGGLTYSSRIYLDRDDALGNVLGANAMMGHDVLFDMDTGRIGFSESQCDYARLISDSKKSGGGGGRGGSRGSSGGGGAAGAGSFGSMNEGGEGGDDDDGYSICGSMKCRGFFGLTITVLFCLFFAFARRYVTKRDTDHGAGISSNAAQQREYEMKSSRNFHSSVASHSSYSDDELGAGSRYSDKNDRYSDDDDDDVPQQSYEDYRRSSGRHRSERRSSSREGGERHRGGSEQRRSSRERLERRGSEGTTNTRSEESLRSGKSHSSGGSDGSGGSRETRRSSRSHRSHGSSRSRNTQRSSGTSGRSHRSGGSHGTGSGSRRSSGSRHRKDQDRGSGDYSDGGGGRKSSGRSRYSDDYDDIPMPPAIT